MKETDLRQNDETSSNKEKGNVINSELGSETCDTHTWCDARLGDLIVIVKSNGFPVHNMQLLNSTNTSLHLHSLCRVFRFQKWTTKAYEKDFGFEDELCRNDQLNFEQLFKLVRYL